MSYPEQFLKLDPQRSLYLQGVDAYGAFASLTNATATGFKVNTVFRDQGDFAVINLADSENGCFEHPLMRPLPDFDYSGLTLSFDLSSAAIWPIDSRYFPTDIPMRLGVITHDLTTGAEQSIVCSLWENATLTSGAFTAASVSFTSNGTPVINDVITLFIGNTAFEYTGTGFDTAATVVSSLTVAVNTYDWSSFAQASVAVFATWNGSTGMKLTFARTGKVTVSGSTVTWAANGSLPSELFVGLTPGLPFVIDGNTYAIASVTDARHLVLTSSPGIGAGPFTYMAPMGGTDGNGLTCYIIPLPSNTGISMSATTLPFTGGVSDGLVWTINCDLATLTGVDPAHVANPLDPSVTQYSASAIRKMWVTIAPRINPAGAYADTEGSLTISNWNVSGTGRNLYIAGPGSVRIGSRDSWATYTGTWSEDAANVHYQGYAHVSSTSGDSISVKYSCGATHDLYIGTEFYTDRQIVNVSLDGDSATAFDTYQSAQSWGRRKLRSSVAAGNHVVTITLSGTHNASAVPAGGLYSFLFDLIEAAVPGLVQAPSVTYANVSAALDYDTFPYQCPPVRLVWELQTLGFLGKTNLDLGVFWLYNRVRVGGTFDSATVTFSGSTWNYGDSANVNISGFSIDKSIAGGDTPTTIAAHFAYYINSASSGFWSSASAGVLTITQRSTGTNFAATVTASVTHGGGGSGAVSPGTQSVGVGVEGTWTLNDAASPLLNSPITAWLTDFYATLAAAGMENVTAVTMEVVQPPSGYAAQFADGSDVKTATGFGVLTSTQSRVAGSLVLTLQKETIKEFAALQNAAGLTVNWQAGELLFWYFSKVQSVPLGNVANIFPAVIGLTAHGMSTGQNCIIVGAEGGTGVNGTWSVTVIDADHFSIAVAGGLWTPGTGFASYGGQAYYDPETAAAAVVALGRPLASFWCQDDDPTINPADVAFLQARLMAHYNALQSYITGLYPGAIAEILWPHDVDVSPLYWNASWPYAQGGRLNNAVNWPPAMETKATSGFDTLLVEGLSWSASYHNLDQIKAAIAWPFTGSNSWAIANTVYLAAVFTGSCCWIAEVLAAQNAGYPQLRLWALDQTNTMDLAVSPMPVNQATVTS